MKKIPNQEPQYYRCQDYLGYFKYQSEPVIGLS